VLVVFVRKKKKMKKKKEEELEVVEMIASCHCSESVHKHFVVVEEVIHHAHLDEYYLYFLQYDPMSSQSFFFRVFSPCWISVSPHRYPMKTLYPLLLDHSRQVSELGVVAVVEEEVEEEMEKEVANQNHY